MSCGKIAQRMHRWLIFSSVVHLLSFFSCVQREVYDNILGTFGRFTRLIEIVCIKCYLFLTIVALGNISIFHYYQNLERMYPQGRDQMQMCLIDEDQVSKWSGSAKAFSFIEVLI